MLLAMPWIYVPARMCADVMCTLVLQNTITEISECRHRNCVIYSRQSVDTVCVFEIRNAMQSTTISEDTKNPCIMRQWCINVSMWAQNGWLSCCRYHRPTRSIFIYPNWQHQTAAHRWIGGYTDPACVCIFFGCWLLNVREIFSFQTRDLRAHTTRTHTAINLIMHDSLHFHQPLCLFLAWRNTCTAHARTRSGLPSDPVMCDWEPISFRMFCAFVGFYNVCAYFGCCLKPGDCREWKCGGEGVPPHNQKGISVTVSCEKKNSKNRWEKAWGWIW